MWWSKQYSAGPKPSNHYSMVADPANQSRAQWSAAKDRFMVEEILKAQRAGKRAANGFTKEAWKTLLQTLIGISSVTSGWAS